MAQGQTARMTLNDVEYAAPGEKYRDEKYRDEKYVVARLEEAGATLLALPHAGYSTRLRTSSLDIVRTALEAYGWGEARAKPIVPPARKIDEMEQALAWIPLIPLDRYVLRRIVGARSLVSPLTGRHVFPWRRLAAAIGADHKAVQRWHAQGIGLIVAALNGAERHATTGR